MTYPNLRSGFAAIAGMLVLGTALPASAHHAMDGETPSTLFQGLLSGLAHPVIGVDHLAFILAVGIAACFMANRYLTPLAFVGATVAGCVLQLAGIGLPLAEIVIAGSAVLLGALVLSGRSLSMGSQVALFAVAGLFHGWAYGESIIGAETTPLVAYLAGFAAIQYAICIGTGLLVNSVWKGATAHSIQPRLAGAVLAGVGLAFLIENVEGMLFAV